MCQGVVVSLVKFKSKGKTKSVILSGIGSHSELLSENQKRLKRLGWKESPTDRVFSIESDFSAWNRFTVEWGCPNRNEFALLAKEYKRIGGSANALLRHVKRVGKVDDALVNLLTEDAQKLYDEAMAPTWKAYHEAMAPTWKAYEEAKATAWKAYNEAKAPAWKAYEEAIAPTWIKLFSVKSNRVTHLQ